MLTYWAYMWFTGKRRKGAYDIHKPGSWAWHVSWPGSGGILPGVTTLEVTRATNDAALVELCHRKVEDGTASNALKACLARIDSEIPAAKKDLRRIPRGTVDAWRRILVAALDAE